MPIVTASSQTWESSAQWLMAQYVGPKITLPWLAIASIFFTKSLKASGSMLMFVVILGSEILIENETTLNKLAC